MWGLQVTLIVIQIFAATSLETNFLRNGNVESNRSDRMYFPFLKLVIPPEPCGSSGTDSVRDGICMPRGKCQTKGGNRIGDCGMGFGECCQFMRTCNSTYREVQITNEVARLHSPMPIDSDCRFTILQKKDYCALKLDFVTFTSESANYNGTCERDNFAVRGSTTVQDGFQVCGDLTGQHMYLEFDRGGSIDLIPSFTGSDGNYQIVATQIPCVSPYRVPSWCLQYYNSTKGQVHSFGYPVQQQNNQEYTVCIGGINNIESVQWKPCSTQGQTMLVNSSAEYAFFIANKGLLSTEPPRCEGRDWVQINGRNQICEFRDIKDGVKSTVKPFTLNVNFNDRERDMLPCLNDFINVAPDPAVCSDSLLTDGSCLKTYYVTCFPEENKCNCALNGESVLVKAFQADNMNTGFCLEYQQLSRR